MERVDTEGQIATAKVIQYTLGPAYNKQFDAQKCARSNQGVRINPARCESDPV